jgi:hypothetical protein
MVHYFAPTPSDGAAYNMTLYYQETSSRIAPRRHRLSARPAISTRTDFRAVPIDDGRAFTLVLRQPNETRGGVSDARLFSSMWDLDIVEPARRAVIRLENRDVVERAQRVLDIIQEILGTLTRDAGRPDHLPVLQAFGVDDGSALVEWTFPDLRLGFSVEPNPDNSSWYLVTTRKLGDINASGHVATANLRSLIPWLLRFVLANT